MELRRIATIVDWPTLKSVHDIQVFLGFCNFYRRFIEAYSRIVLAMTTLLRKSSEEFKWTPEAQQAFERLKLLFTQAPILHHFDPELPIFLYTDASGFAISGILCQFSNGVLHPIAFWSRKATPAECNYNIHDREMLAIVSAFQHWRQTHCHRVHRSQESRSIHGYQGPKSSPSTLGRVTRWIRLRSNAYPRIQEPCPWPLSTPRLC